MCRKIILFNFLFFAVIDFALAQQIPAKTDSSKVYRDIETFSKKRKSTNFLYRIFFRPIDIPKAKKSKRKKKKNLQKPYCEFEGKIIRAIYITTLDPFGYSATDTTIVAQKYLFKAGNKLHIKTQQITIQNLLLIRKNDTFDSLLVRESERLIRSQKYVHDVLFYVVQAGKKSDSVDVFIRELDTWSIIPEGSGSTANINVSITENNFLGTGHQYQNSFGRNFTTGIDAFNTTYSIPNIRNTYVSSTVHYGIDGYGNFNKSLTVDRPFFSPFAKWAAGVAFTSQFKKDSLKDINLINVPFNSRFTTHDYWAGNAIRLFKGNTEDARVTNLILTARYLQIRYFEKPPQLYDPFHIYSNEDFYLGGIGISTRKYVQDKYVFNYGVPEDVPVGKAYGLTGGYQIKNNVGRLYLGLHYSYGNYNQWGYLSWNFEYGTFYRSSYPEQGVFTASINYFTDIFAIGSWNFRQFVKPQLTLGTHRFLNENITINNENGIRGFSSIAVPGTKKILLTLQTQSYSPWNVLGFHFGPYLIYSLGMLGNASTEFRKSEVFSEFALGVLINNEYLMFNYFQLSVSFYPIIPGTGENVFKINATSTSNFGFNDFVIGKPAPVVYQ